MTEDGVGVLAQTNMFNPVEDLNALRDIPIDDFIRLAQENMDAGFWGNALFYLKECWHRDYYNSDDKILKPLKNMMMEVYTAMGRPVYAERLEEETSWA
jgi:hypothetical protein